MYQIKLANGNTYGPQLRDRLFFPSHLDTPDGRAELDFHSWTYRLRIRTSFGTTLVPVARVTKVKAAPRPIVIL